MTGKLYILAGGGTGGHLYPGLAVAEELRRREPQAKIVFACSDRPLDRRILGPIPDVAAVEQPVRPLPRRVGDVPAFLRAWSASRRLAREMLGDLKPSAVLGLGGFAAGPVVREAARQGIRRGLLNPDAVPGKANRYLARHAQVLFAQFASVAEYLPGPVRQRVQVVGCPVRREIATGTRDEAMHHFGLDAGRRTLAVFGGSSGAATVNAAVAALGDELARRSDRWQVLHVAGPDRAGLPGGYPGSGSAVRLIDYCRRMDLGYAAADLALCRGGAVTVAELSATGTPAVIMPYPYHRDQQQRHNAAELVAAGAAVLCEDAIDARANAERLRKVVLPLLDGDAAVSRMREAVGAAGRAEAAADVAGWLAGSKGIA